MKKLQLKKNVIAALAKEQQQGLAGGVNQTEKAGCRPFSDSCIFDCTHNTLRCFGLDVTGNTCA